MGEAEQKVRRLGAHKAINRGLFDRYTTKSVLKGANANQTRIDKTVAEIMNSESTKFTRQDLVMVPSLKSVTGWKYVENTELDKIRDARKSKLPGINGVLKPKAIGPLSKDDPNQMFPSINHDKREGLTNL